MASRAVAYVTDVTVDGDGMVFHANIQIEDGTRHYSLTYGPVSIDVVTLTVQGNLRAWAKDYATNTMGQSFGLLDGVRLVNCDLLP